MSVVPVICETQQCQNVQGDGQRPERERYIGEIAVVGQTVRWKGITDRKVIGAEKARWLCK